MRVHVGDDLIYRPGFGDDLPTQVTIKAMTVTEIARDKYGEDVHEVDYSLVQDNKVVFILNDNHWCYSDQVDKVIPKGSIITTEKELDAAVDALPEAEVREIVKQIASLWYVTDPRSREDDEPELDPDKELDGGDVVEAISQMLTSRRIVPTQEV
jgi:hypothetical protein